MFEEIAEAVGVLGAHDEVHLRHPAQQSVPRARELGRSDVDPFRPSKGLSIVVTSVVFSVSKYLCAWARIVLCIFVPLT